MQIIQTPNLSALIARLEESGRDCRSELEELERLHQIQHQFLHYLSTIKRQTDYTVQSAVSLLGESRT